MYDPLLTPTSIRLLRYDGRRDGIPTFSLHTFEIDQAPIYYALSYTWGNPYAEERPEYLDRRQVCCNGTLVDVGLNLSEALNRLPDLERFDLDFRNPSEYRKTRLITAAEEGRLHEVEALLRAGADVSVADHFGETALHYAAENAHLDIVKALTRQEHVWKKGWMLDVRDNTRRTPLDCARQKKRKNKDYRETIAYLECLKRRDFGSQQFWWVDALCIDQSNTEERSSQVRLMSSIYSTALHVAVWLGEADENTEQAFRTIRALAKANDTGSLSYSAPHNLVAITSFFGRRWFARTWVVQEALLAKEIGFYCGPECLEEKLFKKFQFRKGAFATIPGGAGIQKWRETLATVQQGLQLGQLRSQVSRGSLLQMKMYDLMFYVSRTHCLEPRDRILGLLSLLEKKDTKSLPRMKLDYSMPSGHLYTQATRHLLWETRNLSALTWAAAWSSPKSLNPDENRPSWVPDYHAFATVRGPSDTLEFHAKYVAKNLNQLESLDPVSELEGWHWFNSCGSLTAELNAQAYSLNSPPSLTFYPELQVNGLCVDRVKRTALPCNGQKIRFQADWLSLTADLPVTSPGGLSLPMVLACTVFGGVFKHELFSQTNEARQLTFYEDMVKMSWGPSRFIWQDLIRQSVVDDRHPNPAGRELLGEKAIAEMKRLKDHDGYDCCMVWPTDIDSADVKVDDADAQFRGQLGEEVSLMYRKMFESALSHRRLYSTEKGHLGLGPAGLQAGDEVWLLPGSTVPFVLRPGEQGDHYIQVGETYIHEMMNGEAVPKDAKKHLKSIVLT